MGSIYYFICIIISKTNWLIPALLLFPLLLVILPVKSPCTINISARTTPLVYIDVAGHGGCCQVFSIWGKITLSDPFWKLICRILVLVTIDNIYLVPEVSLGMELLVTLVTTHIWPVIWLSSRATTISIAVAIEVRFSKKPCWMTVKFPQCMNFGLKYVIYNSPFR